MKHKNSKIIFIAMRIEPVLTGGEKYNSHLIAAIENSGVEVVRVSVSSNAIYQQLSDMRFFWRFCRVLAFCFLHIKIIQHRHDTLVFDGWLAPLLWPGVLLIKNDYMVMVHHLSAEFYKQAWRRHWEVFCEQQLLRGAKRVLTVSRSSKDKVDERTLGGMAVDIINPAFEPVGGLSVGGGETARILYVGHVTRVKGMLELIEAVTKLSCDALWRLDIVGDIHKDPETVERMKTMIHDVGLEERVCLCGRLDDDALLALYLTSDIFVLPSYWEGYGIVLLEAMSHKLAVISTEAGAIPEVVNDGKTGLLVPPRDVDALRNAIVLLLEDKILRGLLAEQGLAFVSNHPDWKGMEAQCIQWCRKFMR